MSEYIIYESKSDEVTDYLGVKHYVSHYEKCEDIVRCRDCEHYANCMCFMPDGDGDFKRWEMMPNGFCSEGLRRQVKR